MLFNEVFRACVAHDGIVAVASCSKDGQAHVANTWNKYLILTEDEKILIPCFGFRKTEENAKSNPQLEVTIGSHEVQGKMGMGTGFLSATACWSSRQSSAARPSEFAKGRII